MFALKSKESSRRLLRRALATSAVLAATFVGGARLRGQPVAEPSRPSVAPAVEPAVPTCAECTGVVDSLLPLSSAGRVRDAIY